jgi:hypothetical protein
MGDPNKTTLVGRLSKDGKRVLCDRPNCGATLADVVVNAGVGYSVFGASTTGAWLGWDRNHEAALRRVDPLTVFDRAAQPPVPVDDRATVVFRSGWLADEDDVWTLAKSARKRYDSTRQMAAGGSFIGLREAERARQQLSAGRWARFAHPAADETTGVTQASHPEHRVDLPTFARCPDCGGVNRLDKQLVADAIARIAASESN